MLANFAMLVCWDNCNIIVVLLVIRLVCQAGSKKLASFVATSRLLNSTCYWYISLIIYCLNYLKIALNFDATIWWHYSIEGLPCVTLNATFINWIQLTRMRRKVTSSSCKFTVILVTMTTPIYGQKLHRSRRILVPLDANSYRWSTPTKSVFQAFSW